MRDGLIDVRPVPVFVVGVTGHRDNSLIKAHADAISANVQNILVRIQRGLISVVATPGFLRPGQPALKMFGMAAEGADLVAMKAAHDLGIPIASVLPFPIEEYRKDFSTPQSSDLFDVIVGCCESKLELPGTRSEGARSYERANDIILSNCDLLIAIWDGALARGRAGTGDVVEQAFEQNIPVIVIDPENPDDSLLLIKPRDDGFQNKRAFESERKRLPENLDGLIATALVPPNLRASRRILGDLYTEKNITRSFRFEYVLLLRLLGSTRIKKRAIDEELAWGKARATSSLCDQGWAAQIDVLSTTTHQLDRLAARYGRLFRSSSTSGYFLAIVVSLVSGIVGILFPSLSGATLSVQGAVGALIFADRWIGERQRWQEKWLTYRCMSERLKTLRFLHVFGLSSHFSRGGLQSTDLTSVEWFVRRVSRGMGLPKGIISSAVVASGFDQVRDIEIEGQIAYHQAACHQLGVLERRLSWAASASILGIIALVLAPSLATWIGAAQYEAPIKAFASILLAMLPAALAAFSGIRADADLVRLTERSAWSAAYLSKLKRAMVGQAATFDKYEEFAKKTASFMAAELLEWHMVLESRRARLSRRRAFRYGLFKRIARSIGLGKLLDIPR